MLVDEVLRLLISVTVADEYQLIFAPFAITSSNLKERANRRGAL